ncbi:MAG: N-acetyltransferase family protein [Candidatus Tectimicrobiota bacterium]
MTAAITVRRIRAAEWEQLRTIRLQALADAPLAFSSNLAHEQAQPAAFWQERAAGGATDEQRATFIAERQGIWLGLVTCVRTTAGAGQRPAWVLGMWVNPTARRQRVAQALLRLLIAWARQHEVDVLNLHVTSSNTSAIALYQRLGFQATGTSRPLPHTPSMHENHMTYAL